MSWGTEPIHRHRAVQAVVDWLACINLWRPRASLFAADVRMSSRRLNRNGDPHCERSVSATMPFVAVEDATAFHVLAERCRLAMLAQLREMDAPINVWRLGMMGGVVASRIETRTFAGRGWCDAQVFYVRTRVSVERPPFTHEG